MVALSILAGSYRIFDEEHSGHSGRPSVITEDSINTVRVIIEDGRCMVSTIKRYLEMWSMAPFYMGQ